MKNSLRQLLQPLPLPLLIVACLTLGLAPFSPQPHLIEKLNLWRAGQLVRAIDIFDLAFHALPWLLLLLKLMSETLHRKNQT